jgi:hypothetical protein
MAWQSNPNVYLMLAAASSPWVWPTSLCAAERLPGSIRGRSSPAWEPYGPGRGPRSSPQPLRECGLLPQAVVLRHGEAVGIAWFVFAASIRAATVDDSRRNVGMMALPLVTLVVGVDQRMARADVRIVTHGGGGD